MEMVLVSLVGFEVFRTCRTIIFVGSAFAKALGTTLVKLPSGIVRSPRAGLISGVISLWFGNHVGAVDFFSNACYRGVVALDKASIVY